MVLKDKNLGLWKGEEKGEGNSVSKGFRVGLCRECIRNIIKFSLVKMERIERMLVDDSVINEVWGYIVEDFYFKGSKRGIKSMKGYDYS